MKRIIFFGASIVVALAVFLTSAHYGSNWFWLDSVWKRELHSGISEGVPSEIPRDVTQSSNVICYKKSLVTASSGNQLTVSIYAKNISSKLLGVAFDLTFDQKSLSYISYDHGTFFERGGIPIYISKSSSRSAKIVNGVSLKRGDKLQNGSGLIISFNFKTKNKNYDINSKDFLFKNTVAATIENGQRKNIAGIKWTSCEAL